jgi:hypothetical protein
MPFTDRNHILLKLGILAIIGLYVFGPTPEDPDPATMCAIMVAPSLDCEDPLDGAN